MIRLLTAFLLFASFSVAADTEVPHTFQDGEVIEAQKFNEDFDALEAAIDANAAALPPTNCTTDQIIRWDGTNDVWVCAADPLANLSGCSVGDVLSYDGNAVACGYAVKPSAGAGGSISPDTVLFISAGDTTTFTVSPDSGWEVASIDGTCGGSLSGNTYTTNPIRAACTVEASFRRYHTVTPTVIGGGGIVDPSSPFIVQYGGQAIIDVYADWGCSVSDNYTGSCPGDLHLFSEDYGTFFIQHVTYDCTFEARFECP